MQKYGKEVFVHVKDLDDPNTVMEVGDEVFYKSIGKGDSGRFQAAGVRLVRPKNEVKRNTSNIYECKRCEHTVLLVLL